MNAIPVRAPFQGLGHIVRFNWPFYAVASALLAIGLSAIPRLPFGAGALAALYAAAGLASLWLAGSLAASWLVYDRSPLMTCRWLVDALGFRPATWITIHAGFDDTTSAVRTQLRGTRGRVFDIFDPVEMTEPSIARARRTASPDVDSESVDFRRLPAATGTVEAVLLLLSAHELRTDASRVALFTEIRRVLASGGRVVVAEHLRDWPNFIAFGPGFLHFHSRRAWTRSFTRAGFAVDQEFSITPFVRVFVLGERS